MSAINLLVSVLNPVVYLAALVVALLALKRDKRAAIPMAVGFALLAIAYGIGLISGYLGVSIASGLPGYVAPGTVFTVFSVLANLVRVVAWGLVLFGLFFGAKRRQARGGGFPPQPVAGQGQQGGFNPYGPPAGQQWPGSPQQPPPPQQPPYGPPPGPYR